MSGTNPAVEEAFDTPSKANAQSAGGNKAVEDAFDTPAKDHRPQGGGNQAVEDAFDTPSKPEGSNTNAAVDQAFDTPSKSQQPSSRTAVDEAFDQPSNETGRTEQLDAGQKSKFEKMVDPTKKAVGADNDKGESKTSSKLKETLKGGHHAT